MNKFRLFIAIVILVSVVFMCTCYKQSPVPRESSCNACSNVSPLMLVNANVPTKKIVYSYSPQCGHCKDFMPVWDEFSSVIGGDIEVEKVNCRENPERCSDIMGVPDVKIHTESGKKIKYTDERTVRGLLSFVSMN